MNRALIQHILSDDPVRPLLNGDGWQRVYGRAAANGAILVYENPGGAATAMVAQLSPDTSNIEVRPWTHDAALPALPQLIARHPRSMPVRYRPGKRCTLRKQDLFLKCVADDRGQAINQDARMLWGAYRSGQLGFGVARPGGWLPSLRMMVQHRVPGAPVIAALHGPDGAKLAHRLGAANATLARAPITPPQRYTYADQMARTAKYAKRLSRFVPATASGLERVMTQLAAVSPGAADRPIHGAPHAHQWLDGPDGLHLVDFDRFGLGDPELDAATFVAEADFEGAPQAKETGPAYLAGFAEIVPLNAQLVQAYRIHKHIAKALRCAMAIRLDAGERATAIIADVQALIGKRP